MGHEVCDVGPKGYFSGGVDIRWRCLNPRGPQSKIILIGVAVTLAKLRHLVRIIPEAVKRRFGD